MLGKLTGLARALALLLALVAGFVALPFDVKIVLLVLGLIAGIGASADSLVGRGVTVLILPAVGAALALIPVIGTGLNAAAGNIAAVVVATLATTLAIRFFNVVKDDLTGLAK